MQQGPTPFADTARLCAKLVFFLVLDNLTSDLQGLIFVHCHSPPLVFFAATQPVCQDEICKSPGLEVTFFSEAHLCPLPFPFPSSSFFLSHLASSQGQNL